MNTVLLTDCGEKREDSHWWAQMLRSFATRPPERPPRDDAGAQRVTRRLAAILDDNWTLICGYRNSVGRLEHVLVGPRGVIALASTALHGRIHCKGEQWQRDKYDLYNNLVERDADIKPGPAAELLACAAGLEALLSAQTSIRHVAAGLIFTHDAATLGDIRQDRLALVSTLAELKSATLLHALSGHPDHKTIDGVVDVIRREHNRFVRHAGQGGGRRQPLFLER